MEFVSEEIDWRQVAELLEEAQKEIEGRDNG